MTVSKKKTAKIKKDTPLSRFIDNFIYVFIAFLSSAVLMLLVYYCYDIIPFGGKTVLRMDLFHQYGPLFAEFYDRLTHFKSFLYSWNTGGGGAFLGNYFNYLSSPVGDIIALIAGHKNIPEAIGTMVLVKNALAASTLAYYLKKKHGKNDFAIAAFGILYSFCGFFIAYYWNIMWVDAMYILPLAVLGIENIINERKCKLYVIVLAFSFLANYYMSYMICIFAVLYFLVHFVSTSSIRDSYSDIPVKTDDEGKTTSTTLNRIVYNKFLRSGVLFAVSSVLAVALVAVAVVPTYFCLKACSATSGSFPQDMKLYNNIFDFLANHLASLEPTIRSSGDTVLPNVYCGILTVMLVPLYIFCDKISTKARAAHIVLLAVFFVGFNLNSANYVLHAFHFPNDLPFRFSFLYSFLLITMAYEVLLHIKKISSKAVLGAGVGVILFAIIVQRLGMDNVSDNTVYISIGFAALYTMVLALMRKKEYAQTAVSLLLMCCVFAEVAIADIDHFKITQEKVNFVNGYNDFRSLKDTLDKKEKTDKYRLEVTNINTLMDASWFNYNGISVFSSMAYEKSANLQNQLGLDSNYINSYIYYSQTPVYNAMMGLKYLVKNDENTPVNDQLFKFAGQCGKFTAYENKYYLPIAYCVDEDMLNLDSSDSNPFTIQNNFWYNATGTYGVLKQIDATDYDTDNVTETEDYLTNSFTCFKTNNDAEGTLKINFKIPETQNVYLYFNSYSLDSINVYNADTDFSKNQSIDEPYILDCGLCKAGEVITVELNLDEETESFDAQCYMYGLDKEILDAGYEVLSHNVMSIDKFEETSIKGTVDIAEGKILYTSINYDDGWTVKVDGKEHKKDDICDALIALKLEPGKHTIEFNYMPKGLIIGAAISVGTLLLLIIILLVNSLLKKDRSDKKRERKVITRNIPEENINEEPTGIDAMMAEDLGKDATVEDAEALLTPPDIYDGQLEKNAEGLSKADEILNTQKLNLKEILDEISIEIREED
ncbi:MAG: YfhO family protein [Clostridia bacterium]|nr:YfhO family protein [Clostridia bacterium]